MLKGSDLWGDPQTREDNVYAPPLKRLFSSLVRLALVQASCDWDSRGADVTEQL